MTLDELIIIRMKYCHANNIKYQNTALLKEMYDRDEGKIPLRVLNHPAEEEESLSTSLRPRSLRTTSPPSSIALSRSRKRKPKSRSS